MHSKPSACLLLCLLSLYALSACCLSELSLWALSVSSSWPIEHFLSPLFCSLLSPLLSEPSLKLCISWSLSLSLSWALSRALSSHILHTTFPHPSHAFLSSIALFESFYKAGINKVHTHTDGQRSNIPSSWAPVGVKKLLEITDKWIRKYHHHQPSKLLFNALFAWLILRDIFLVILDISLKKKNNQSSFTWRTHFSQTKMFHGYFQSSVTTKFLDNQLLRYLEVTWKDNFGNIIIINPQNYYSVTLPLSSCCPCPPWSRTSPWPGCWLSAGCCPGPRAPVSH